jgi:cytochrome c oxidase assembly factor 6
MGWLWGSSKPEQPTVASRQDREVCWESRDAYFDCLDKADVVKAGDEGTSCSSQKTDYEKNCAKSWVSTLSYHSPSSLLMTILMHRDRVL